MTINPSNQTSDNNNITTNPNPNSHQHIQQSTNKHTLHNPNH